jgi:hypothetical protein
MAPESEHREGQPSPEGNNNKDVVPAGSHPGQTENKDGQPGTQGKEGQGKEGQGKEGQGKEGQGKEEGQQPGKGQGQGEGEGQGPGPQSGQPGGDPKTADQPPLDRPGTGPGQGHGSPNNSTAENHTDDPPTGGGNGEGTVPGGPGTSRDAHKAAPNFTFAIQQADELIDELRDESLEASTVLITPSDKHVLEVLHPDIHSPKPRNNIQVIASFERIRAPMDQLIALLRTELERSQRQYELTDQTQEKAPLAYSEAVADYFEQLSRDYQPAAPAPAPADPADANSVPTP